MASHTTSSSRTAAATSSPASATATFVRPVAAPIVSHGFEAAARDSRLGENKRRGFGSHQRNEGTQTALQQQQQHLPAPASLSQLSRSAGNSLIFGLSCHVSIKAAAASAMRQLMHSIYAVDQSSSCRERGGGKGGSSSSFDTSATQMKGNGGDGSSSDLSMSPPPPPTFDFVVKDAKGEQKRVAEVSSTCTFFTFDLCADVEDMIGRLCAVMEVLMHDAQHLTCSM
jgi:hypothetical protein